MRQTRLILLEGIPGAGKSALAQWLTHSLVQRGQLARWWYEEELGHPVYLFNDMASMQRVLDALAGGRYPEVIANALDQWQRFADAQREAPDCIVIDGCLFGYLAWTLFHFDVATDEISAYVDRVAAILAPLAPTLICCVQHDVAGTLARLTGSRGASQRARYIQNIERSPYGLRHALRGFDGLVAYWQTYQTLVASVYARLDLTKGLVDTSAGDWTSARQVLLRLLELPPIAPDAVPHVDPARLCGVYAPATTDGRPPCHVTPGDRGLSIEGLPHIWPRTTLIPLRTRLYAVEALPFEVRFAVDSDAAVVGLAVLGPPLLAGNVAGSYRRMAGAAY